jgi:pimeloyl-ACP methyl ester carboxylesterase
LMYAGLHPDLVTRLIAVEGFGRPAIPRALMPTPEQRLLAWIDNGRALAGRSPRRYASLDDAFLRMQEANGHLTPEQARYLTVHGANQNEDGTYSWKFDNYVHLGSPYDLSEEEVRGVWRNITCPVLLINGAESWAHDPADIDRVLGYFQNVRHEVIAEAGHWPHHDRLDDFVELVGAFLA